MLCPMSHIYSLKLYFEIACSTILLYIPGHTADYVASEENNGNSKKNLGTLHTFPVMLTAPAQHKDVDDYTARAVQAVQVQFHFFEIL